MALTIRNAMEFTNELAFTHQNKSYFFYTLIAICTQWQRYNCVFSWSSGAVTAN
jgi:hypothetical protein